MKRPFLSAGLIALSLALSLTSTGCSQTGAKQASGKSSKPDDPTSWADRDVTNDAAGRSSSLPKTSRLSGGWSSEARDIEKSMGVGN